MIERPTPDNQTEVQVMEAKEGPADGEISSNAQPATVKPESRLITIGKALARIASIQ